MFIEFCYANNLFHYGYTSLHFFLWIHFTIWCRFLPLSCALINILHFCMLQAQQYNYTYYFT